MAEASGGVPMNPVSAIAGAVGDMFGAVSSGFGFLKSGQETKQERERTKQVNAQVEMQELQFLNTGVQGILGFRAAELEIQRQKVENEGRRTPASVWFFLIASLMFFSLLGLYAYQKMKTA